VSEPAPDHGALPGKPASGGAPPTPSAGVSVPSGALAWLPWLAAAGFALLSGFLLEAYLAVENEVVELRTQAALAAIDARSLRQTLEAERIISARRLADRAQATPAPAGATPPEFVLMLPPNASVPAIAIAVWRPGAQEGTLIVQHLPVLADDRSYHLWIEDSQPPAQAAGAFEAAASGETRFHFQVGRPPGTGARFVVTIEPKAGASTMAGPVVLLSQ
jgi:hypothetical protein